MGDTETAIGPSDHCRTRVAPAASACAAPKSAQQATPAARASFVKRFNGCLRG